jgi:ribosome-binding factor A
MRNYKRSIRIAELLKEKISEILLRKVNDPRLNAVTITRVELTDDLKYAKIFFSSICSDLDIKVVQSSLKGASKYIRTLIGKDLELRYVPEITFLIDENLIESIRIFELLEKIHTDTKDKDKDA